VNEIYPTIQKEAKLEKSGRGIKSIEIGNKLLKVLVDKCEPLSLSDLAAASDIAAAQAHAYLLSYRKLELVEQDPTTRLYRLGSFAMRLGVARLHNNVALQAGQQATSELSNRLGLTAVMLVAAAGTPTVVHVSEGLNRIPLNLHQGSVWSITGTITGRVFAAFMDSEAAENQIQAELSQTTEEMVNAAEAEFDRTSFQQHVDNVKKQGYASGSGIIRDVGAIAAPVCDSSGNLLFVLSLVAPEPLMNNGNRGATVKALLDATQRISAEVHQLDLEIQEAEKRPKRGRKAQQEAT
jgi:DNA-binding IclR family transcriptional regulator